MRFVENIGSGRFWPILYKSGTYISVAGIGWLTLSLVTMAEQEMPQIESPRIGKGCSAGDDFDLGRLRQRMLSDGVTETSPSWKSTTIRVNMNRGRLDSPVILEGSGDAQFDFDCLQAVLGISHATHSISDTLDETFSKNDFTSQSSTDNKPSKTGKYLTMHVIPVDILQRFFGSLFTKEELLGKDNLIRIPNNSSKKVSTEAIATLKRIYCDEWGPVINEGAQVNKEDVLKKRREIVNGLTKGSH